MRLAALLTMLAPLPALAAAAPMAGTWFGSGQPWDRSAMYIDSMMANGDFRSHHRFCVRGKATDQYESGHWRLDGDRMTIAIDTVNGKPQPRTDSYRVVSHDAASQHYVFLPMNFAYASRRVADGFPMPRCDLVS